MFILKTSLSLLLFFVFIIYFTIRKVNPLCEKIIYTRKKVGGRPTSPAESRVSLSGCILSHHQVTRFGISDSHGFARRKAPSKPVPCLSQGTLVGQEAAHSPRATAFFADSDAAYCRDRRMIVLRPSVIRHKFRLYPRFTAGRLDQDVPYDIAYRRWKCH